MLYDSIKRSRSQGFLEVFRDGFFCQDFLKEKDRLGIYLSVPGASL